jgi:hypothetical protein
MRDVTVFAPPGTAEPHAEISPHRFWTAPEPFQADAPTVGDPIVAYANEARWIAECPDCHSAQLTSAADRRFMCSECANVANGGAWRPVTWPRNFAAIEALLDVRQPVNQNWAPGETVADLTAENAARVSP